MNYVRPHARMCAFELYLVSNRTCGRRSFPYQAVACFSSLQVCLFPILCKLPRLIDQMDNVQSTQQWIPAVRILCNSCLRHETYSLQLPVNRYKRSALTSRLLQPHHLYHVRIGIPRVPTTLCIVALTVGGYFYNFFLFTLFLVVSLDFRKSGSSLPLLDPARG